MKNPFGKTRSEDKPYAIYANGKGWFWKILKTYKRPDSEKKDPNARWFVSATSPMMLNGSYEMGDTYVADILAHGYVVECEDEWKKEYNLLV